MRKENHSPQVLQIDSAQTDLPVVGGKGANLSVLARAGFPVPSGFMLTTQAYHDFVTTNNLDGKIQDLLQDIEGDNLESLERVSSQIRALFSAGTIPTDLVDTLGISYRNLSPDTQSDPAVAVRSSATAEDLPDMSFAGQQDTYLNIIGIEALLKAVVNCWSSLWTARAIGYRTRNSVPHRGAALAVIVQEMVQSQASGVLFTANPLSGLRSETVIDAILGLGEALVSGQVEPDHYIVAPAENRILTKTLGAKTIAIQGKTGGGTQTIQANRDSVQALPDAQILSLAQLGQQAAALYDFPQDIEWARAQDKLYILQSRPITSLFPLPDGLPPEPLKVFFSFAAVQGLLDPVTPLGRDTIREIFAAGGRLFGVQITRQTQNVIYTAGERLWVHFSPLLKNSVGRKILPVVFGMIEPSIRQALETIWDDPRLQPGRKGVSIHARTQLARFFIPLAGNVLLNLLSPHRRRQHIVEKGEQIIKEIESRRAAIQGDRWQKLSQQADLLPNFASEYFPSIFRLFVSGVAAGMASWNFLNMLASRAAAAIPESSQYSLRDLVLHVTRGMPNNPTTEMDLDLWELANIIRHDPETFRTFQDSQPIELSTRYIAGELPQTAMQAVKQFLERYGGRGLGEIDLGRRRWADDPTHVFEMIKSFLKIEDETQAPDVVFARGADSAQQAITQLVIVVRGTRYGWLKAWLMRFFASRARQLMGLREQPKFFAVRIFYTVQQALLKTGTEFVQAGELDQPDDLLYLSFSELKAFATQQDQDWQALIQTRRQAYQREVLRMQIPRVLLSDGRAFYEGIAAADASEDGLTGSPVSPGRAEGKVRVVLNPSRAGLQPGEILVCPGTDPSWTPLFLSAAGLVMEVGGLMTHGAVVAREYGIPAIVGVDQATSRLKTGQLIRIDGSSGQIVILSNSNKGI